MLIIGCDFHAGFQVLAIFDNRTGVQTEKRLEHPREVMVARRLAVRLYWMLRNDWTYTELVEHVGKPESSCGKR